MKLFKLLALVMTLPVVTGKCPDNPRGPTRKYNGSCLEFIKENNYQPEAKALCEEYKGHLVTIENREKQSWLENTLTDDLMWINSGNVWLGITRDETTYPTWYLDDGTHDSKGDIAALKYSNWDINEPDANKDRACVVFGYHRKFKWRASMCKQFPYDFQVICQYDGPDGLFTNPAVYIPVIVLLILGLVAGFVFPYYCYQKRKALKNELRKSREEDMYDEDLEEHHIKNTDNNMNSNYTPNNNTPVSVPVANITANISSYHNFNILSDSSYRQDKPLHKDLSLQGDSMLIASGSTQPPIEYTRSVSSPPNFAKASAPPCDEFRIGIDEEDHNVDETSPLHKQRPHSLNSNNLSV